MLNFHKFSKRTIFGVLIWQRTIQRKIFWVDPEHFVRATKLQDKTFTKKSLRLPNTVEVNIVVLYYMSREVFFAAFHYL